MLGCNSICLNSVPIMQHFFPDTSCDNCTVGYSSPHFSSAERLSLSFINLLLTKYKFAYCFSHGKRLVKNRSELSLIWQRGRTYRVSSSACIGDIGNNNCYPTILLAVLTVLRIALENLIGKNFSRELF